MKEEPTSTESSSEGKLPRHIWWRRQYMERRYLQYLSEDELKKRAKDVFTNMWTLSNLGQIGLQTDDVERHYWTEMWTHVLQEFQVRYGPPPAGFTDGFIKEAQIPKPTFPDIPRAVMALQNRKLVTGFYLVKYGKLKYLRSAYEDGMIRLAPASYYSDPSLNLAVNDTELQLRGYLHVQDVGNIELTREAQTDYYVQCLSSQYVPRLFDDFQADSCLLVTDPEKFLGKLTTSKDRLLDWKVITKPVTYVDPANMDSLHLDVFFCKHFRFAYQKEYRIVWQPPIPQTKLEPILLRLGRLEDCTELITFE